MLGLVEAGSTCVSGGNAAFEVTLGGMTIAFDSAAATVERPLEQLASAIEAVVAHARAKAMLAAAGVSPEPLPLWLVTGSSVLARWLPWSNTEGAVRRRLRLSDQVGLAPIAGKLERRARQALGQSSVKVRVRSGLAVGEQIDLPGRLRCVGSFGPHARIRIEGGPWPDTLITALDGEPFHNARRRLAEVVDHPFFAAAELELIGIRNKGAAIVIEVASEWAPLGARAARRLGRAAAGCRPGPPLATNQSRGR